MSPNSIVIHSLASQADGFCVGFQLYTAGGDPEIRQAVRQIFDQYIDIYSGKIRRGSLAPSFVIPGTVDHLISFLVEFRASFVASRIDVRLDWDVSDHRAIPTFIFNDGSGEFWQLLLAISTRNQLWNWSIIHRYAHLCTDRNLVHLNLPEALAMTERLAIQDSTFDVKGARRFIQAIAKGVWPHV